MQPSRRGYRYAVKSCRRTRWYRQRVHLPERAHHGSSAALTRPSDRSPASGRPRPGREPTFLPGRARCPGHSARWRRRRILLGRRAVVPDRDTVAQGELTGRHHLALQAHDVGMVHAFHQAALAHGGRDNGAPGVRPYHPSYYAAFVLDPDGNNIEAVFHGPAQRSADALKITFWCRSFITAIDVHDGANKPAEQHAGCKRRITLVQAGNVFISIFAMTVACAT
ncbi:VOC family protein [Xanthomonas arboricola]|nr:VOC family protein [Xanthomonas arboricola]